MTGKQMSDFELIRAYRSRAAERRRKSSLRTYTDESTPGVCVDNGTVTVTLAANSVSIDKVGGASKALGLSKISIPEYKRWRKSE